MYNSLEVVDKDLMAYVESLLKLPRKELEKEYDTIIYMEEKNRNEILEELEVPEDEEDNGLKI